MNDQEKLKVAKDEFLAIFRVLRGGITPSLIEEIRAMDPFDAMPIIGKMVRERLEEAPKNDIVAKRAAYVIPYIEDGAEHTAGEISELLSKLMTREPASTSLYRVIERIPKIDGRFIVKKSIKDGRLVVVMR